MKKFLIAFLIVVLQVVPAAALDIPERLEYEITWFGITTGYSSLEIKEDGRGNVVIVSTAVSADWVTKIFPVDDRVESVFKASEKWFPLLYRLRTNEGDRHRNWKVYFDRDKGKAYYTNFISKKEKEHEIPDEVYDPLMALYEMRKKDLVVGASAYIPLFDSEKLYDLEVQVLEKERVEVPAGKFDTILIKPMLQSEGIFSREGPIYTWLTDDERKIPVMIKTKVKIGSIYAKLVRIIN
jgi:hypothetical protein